MVLFALALMTLVMEYLWIRVVYKRFPILCEQKQEHGYSRAVEDEAEGSGAAVPGRGLKRWIVRERDDWAEFIRLPIFASEFCRKDDHTDHCIGSIAIAAIYLTTLSYGELSMTRCCRFGRRDSDSGRQTVHSSLTSR